MDLDALDIGPRPLIDDEGDVDASRGLIARDARYGVREGIAELGQLDREDFGGFVQRVAVKRRAGAGEK